METKEEMDDKIVRMMQERNRQNADFRRKYNISQKPIPQPTIEKPLTREEMDDKIARMMQERNRQDAEFRKKYSQEGSSKPYLNRI